MAKKNNRGLGKGIEALLGKINEQDFQPKREAKDGGSQTDQPLNTPSTNEIAIDAIEVNPFQPRKEFDQKKLKELADSIRIHGVIQPITVRIIGGGKYQLIAGERRTRAAKLVGLTRIPAYVRKANDQEMLEIALIENVQRENLNAIEVSLTYQRLLDECSLTHDDLSKRLGVERSTVTNYLRLLRLPPEIQNALKAEKISMGHARALSGCEDVTQQLVAFNEIVRKKLSVRKAEQLIRSFKKGKKESTGDSKAFAALPPEYKQLQKELTNKFESKVNVKYRSNGQGELNIPFTSEDDLNRILDLLL